MMNSYYVYQHKKAGTGEVFYVGKGTRGRAFDKTKRNVYWKRIEEKHGRVVEILKDGIDNELAMLIELEVIATYKSRGIKLCNMTDGGDGCNGYNHTEEHKKYMSESQKGKVMTEEHKAAMRKSKSEAGRLAIKAAQEKLRASGYKPSEESNRKRSNTLKGRPSAMKGKTHTQEAKYKMSVQRKGVPKKTTSCSVCGKHVAVNIINRWHEQNCKEATNECA